MTAYHRLQQRLVQEPRTWLVTGAAGFIGSHLVETLLRLGQTVVGLDNFATGKPGNLDDIRAAVGPEAWQRFRFLEGDITDLAACHRAAEGVDYVLHQAALGSVPRSIEHPLASHAANVTGFVHMLVAARDARVRRFVYASSSAVYGDAPALPKVEPNLGRPLSPYAVTKRVNELYADVFALTYGLETIGLRYFNVFGPRQDPAGPYAAVIPLWILAMIQDRPALINGDGTNSRDFCYVANVVQANLLAATTTAPEAVNQVFNIAVGQRTTLLELFELIRAGLAPTFPRLRALRPVHQPPRAGDIPHSHADIAKAARLLGYAPSHTIQQGMAETLAWYLKAAA